MSRKMTIISIIHTFCWYVNVYLLMSKSRSLWLSSQYQQLSSLGRNYVHAQEHLAVGQRVNVALWSLFDLCWSWRCWRWRMRWEENAQNMGWESLKDNWFKSHHHQHKFSGIKRWKMYLCSPPYVNNMFKLQIQNYIITWYYNFNKASFTSHELHLPLLWLLIPFLELKYTQMLCHANFIYQNTMEWVLRQIC